MNNEIKNNEKEKKQELELLKRIEATLFLSARYLDIQELVKFTGINPLMLKELLIKLEKKYQKNNNSIVILKHEYEGKEKWKMDVKTEYANLTNLLATGQTEFTKAEQATLATIAYKQPIKQSIIVKIRGNKSYDHIKHFIEFGLVKSKKAGRTLELNLSDVFYDYFNIGKKKKEEMTIKQK